SNRSYLASWTPSATFSKSQNSAMLVTSGALAISILENAWRARLAQPGHHSATTAGRAPSKRCRGFRTGRGRFRLTAFALNPLEGGTMLRRLLLVVALVPAAAFAAGSFTLSSAEIKPGATIAEAQVFKGFGCEGGNVSPSLAWNNAPAGTKSFALTVYDPDAPTGSGWWHWVMFNIPADVNALPAGAGD